MPSMVATAAPPTVEIGVRQERVASPSRWTVQAPQSPTPQPNLRALQIEFVAQHPEKRRIPVDIDGPLQAVDFDHISHRPRLSLCS